MIKNEKLLKKMDEKNLSEGDSSEARKAIFPFLIIFFKQLILP